MKRILITLLVLATSVLSIASDKKPAHRLDADGKNVSNAVLAAAAGSMLFIMLPGWMLGDELSDRYGYQEYPFADDDGLKKVRGKAWAFHFTLNDHVGSDLDKHFGFTFQGGWKRILLETGYQRVSLDEDVTGSEWRVMPSFIFAHNEYLEFRLCAGASVYSEDFEGTSIDIAYKVSGYGKPMYFRVSAEDRFYRNDGEDEQFWIVEAECGYVWNRFEVGAGYEYRDFFNEYRNIWRMRMGYWF